MNISSGDGSGEPSQDRTRARLASVKYAALFTGTAVIAGVVGAAIAMPVVGGISALANTAIDSFEGFPTDLADPKLAQRNEIYDGNGKRLAYVYEENRVVVGNKAISQNMQDAMVAIEDSRFYEHNGIDAQGTVRAFVRNSQTGDVVQGGSTITQQLVKMTLLNNAKTPEEEKEATEQTPQRKLKEARFALALEEQKGKKEILTDYLNIAYFGSGAYGIQAAAETYFSKPAKKLNVVESATLAGIVQQPGRFDPKRNPKAATVRRNEVLNRMNELGYINAKEYNKAKKAKIKSYIKFRKFPNGCPHSDEPYFCDYVMKYLETESQFGANKKKRQELIRNGGLKITMTMDVSDQRATKRAVEAYVPTGDASNKIGTITMVEPGTGRVIAMAQNTDWGTKKKVGKSAFNFNVRKKHGGVLGAQAGSTFKPFTLAAALSAGISPYTTINSPGRTTFYGFRDCDGYLFPPYTVANASESTSGVFNMYSGTKGSVNTYFIGLERMVSLCRQAEIAESMGVRMGDGKKLKRVPSFALGSNEVVPVDMAAAYAGFVNDGVWCAPNPIENIRSLGTNKKIYQFSPNCRRALSSRVADTLVALLHGPVGGGGTYSNANFGRPIIGKTGTTDGSMATSFAGAIPQRATYVAVYDPRGSFQYPLVNQYIGGRYYGKVYGATIAGPMWKMAMSGAAADLPVEGFGQEPKHINNNFKTYERSQSEQEKAEEQAQLPNEAEEDDDDNPLSGLFDRLDELDFGFGSD